jgi:hypothetical protein
MASIGTPIGVGSKKTCWHAENQSLDHVPHGCTYHVGVYWRDDIHAKLLQAFAQSSSKSMGACKTREVMSDSMVGSSSRGTNLPNTTAEGLSEPLGSGDKLFGTNRSTDR